MTIQHEILDLENEAEAARRQEQRQQAAFLFDQARRLAIDCGETRWAFSLGARAALCWHFAGDDLRALTMRLELLHNIPAEVDPWDMYWVKEQQFYYLLERGSPPNFDMASSYATELDALCVSLGNPNSRNIPFRKAYLLEQQGRWAGALANYEIAWSRTGNLSGFDCDDSEAPYRCAIVALRTSRRIEAQRWLTHIQSDRLPGHATIAATHVRLLIAVYDNDTLGAHSALLGVDDAIQSAERPLGLVETTLPAVAALLIDERYGDPLSRSHPAQQRLAEFPKNEIKIPQSASIWHSATIIRQIAALRYAAGMRPVDDIYYRIPHLISRRATVRLIDDLPLRVESARQACERARPVANLLDGVFQCSYRQQDIIAMRTRIEEIATAYNL